MNKMRHNDRQNRDIVNNRDLRASETEFSRDNAGSCPSASHLGAGISSEGYKSEAQAQPNEALMTDLLSCPFCGTKWEPNLNSDLEIYSANFGWCVHCHACGVETRGYATEAEAIAAWNTRTPPSSDVERDLGKLQQLGQEWDADDMVERVARAIRDELCRVRRENDAELAKDGFWPDHLKQPTDEQYARAAIAAMTPKGTGE